jgi:hypothetical protein
MGIIIGFLIIIGLVVVATYVVMWVKTGTPTWFIPQTQASSQNQDQPTASQGSPDENTIQDAPVVVDAAELEYSDPIVSNYIPYAYNNEIPLYYNAYINQIPRRNYNPDWRFRRGGRGREGRRR